MLSATMGTLASFGVVGLQNWDAGGFFAGLATSGRGAKVDQKFQKKFCQIDYKIERQGLHREDIRDLMGLTVSRMDMYNVVGALLLTAAIDFLKDSTADLFGTPGSRPPVPVWFALLVFLHNFGAVSYLLFSLWLSMHCSIMTQSVGTRLLLSFARLSIPSKEQIKDIKVAFYSAGFRAGVQRVTRSFIPGSGEAASGAGGTGNSHAADAAAEEPESSDDGEDEPRDPEGTFNDRDDDAELHFRKWLRERGKWLSYDAYSRATMVVGINGFLQSIAYTISSNVWQATRMSAFVCLFISKLLSYHILSIDLGNDAWGCGRRYGFIWIFDFLPPVLALILVKRYPKAPEGSAESVESDKHLGSIFAVVVYALHGIWMIILRETLLAEGSRAQSRDAAECSSWSLETGSFRLCADGEEGPYKDRVGKDRFLPKSKFVSVSRAVEELNSPTSDDPRRLLAFCIAFSASHESWYVLYRGVSKRDVQQELGMEESESEAETPAGGLESSICESYSEGLTEASRATTPAATPAAVSHKYEDKGTRFLPKQLQAVQWMQVVDLKQPISKIEAFEEYNRDRHEFDHQPAQIVRSFTTAMAFVWFAVGVMNPLAKWIEHLLDRGNVDLRPSRRLLSDSQWPSPASLFQVTALQCGLGQVLISSEFATHRAFWLANRTGLGPMEELEGFRGRDLAAAFCDDANSSCSDALVRTAEGNGSAWRWRLVGLPGAGGVEGGGEDLPLPSTWQLPVAAVWASCSGGARDAMWLAGWDGLGISVASSRRAGLAGPWLLQPRLRVRPGVGYCTAGPAVCTGWSSLEERGAGRYGSVQALQLGAEGRRLAVLHGEGRLLDAWDLETGSLLARWRLGLGYAAMCHDGAALHLARPGAGVPPVLEALELPAELQDRGSAADATGAGAPLLRLAGHLRGSAGR